ncbi:MAG: cyanoexosortase B system-associated protein [Synechococcales bacterium]|nr:cyanoexosortase B system-associated protein [Synechococcales bacterium]
MVPFSLPTHWSTRWSTLWAKFLLLGLLLVVAIATLPNYQTGKWRWQQPPPIAILGHLKQVRQQGLPIPGWTTEQQRTLTLGEHPWSIQQIRDGSSEPVMLMLFTQNGPKDQPQVEWTDLDGIQRWQKDSLSTLAFTADQVPVQARFLRAWTARKTYAVLQWYAWATGGNYAPSQWFFADRQAQWHGQRRPWIAVSVILPMEPLDDLQKYRDRALTLGQTLQTTLLREVLQQDQEPQDGERSSNSR